MESCYKFSNTLVIVCCLRFCLHAQMTLLLNLQKQRVNMGSEVSGELVKKKSLFSLTCLHDLTTNLQKNNVSKYFEVTSNTELSLREFSQSISTFSAALAPQVRLGREWNPGRWTLKEIMTRICGQERFYKIWVFPWWSYIHGVVNCWLPIDLEREGDHSKESNTKELQDFHLKVQQIVNEVA